VVVVSTWLRSCFKVARDKARDKGFDLTEKKSGLT